MYFFTLVTEITLYCIHNPSPLKHLFSAMLLFVFITARAQNTDAPQSVFSMSPEALSRVKLEDRHGHLITDPQQKMAILAQRQRQRDSAQAFVDRNAAVLIPVPLCTNGGFEEYENSGSVTVLKNFGFNYGDVLNPMQCRDLPFGALADVSQFTPFNDNQMARTVPANHLDEFIGDIHAFDQYALKINHKNSTQAVSKVQGKRIKTDNETQLKFNYKAVLQVIEDTDHENEQPFTKARVINQAGVVVDEFCLIGDLTNCIFKQAPVLEADAIVLYTPNWQSGILDISSIPNNEEFTIEFVGSRCGLGAHFGYTYVDDICLLHTNENLQGSITLNPLYEICPTLPLQVCGTFTVPNSGGISATVQSITLQVRNATNAVIYTSAAAQIDLVTKTFCFELQAANFPDVANMGYNVSVVISYGLLQTECSGTNFDTATDDDANPGWDIWFLNCTPDCDVDLHSANLTFCDTDHNGTEVFNLPDLNALVTSSAGITGFTYYATLADATAATNAIATPNAYTSPTRTIFVRAAKSDTCFKIIAANLIVKNPVATITGVLNVCTGSTVLTASPGVSYLWGGGQTTPTITATATGNYTVTVTDVYGCQAVGTVTIPSTAVAAQPDIVVNHPTCFTSTGTITVTSPASTYSFDNGVTWGSNASATNLPVGFYTVIIRTITGCESWPVAIGVNNYLAPRPDYTDVDPAFCGDTGSITITDTAAEYSFDDGLTWGPNNTMSGLPSGTYNIRTKDAFGCISNYNSVVLNGEFLLDADYQSQNPYCGNPGNITITTPAAQYSFDGGTTWQTSNVMPNIPAGSYIIKIKDAMGCTSPNRYVYLNNLQSTYPDFSIVNAGCDTYGSVTITTLADDYSFDGGITWTTNPTISNLSGPNSYSIKVRKGTCESRTSTAYFNSSFLPIPVVNDYEAFICDELNNGAEQTNLTDYDSHLVATTVGFTFRYFTSESGADTNSFSEQINNPSAYVVDVMHREAFVRITSPDGCHNVSRIALNLIPTPWFNIDADFPLCVGKTVTIDAGTGYDAYLWSTGETTQSIVIDEPGDYTVTVFEDHMTVNGIVTCSTTRTFNIFLSDKAVWKKIDTYDWTRYDNALTAYVDGIGDYEYSLDNVHFQDSPTFISLHSGDYTVYVRDKFGCGTIIQDVFLLMYDKYFTPNEDNFHDRWKIEFSEEEPGLTIDIFDREGKLLKVLQNHESWDGKYNGRDILADDYWFVVHRRDGRQHRGHFTLKR